MKGRVFMKSSKKIKIREPMHIWGLDLVYPAFVSPNRWQWVSYLEYMQYSQIKNYEIGENGKSIIS